MGFIPLQTLPSFYWFYYSLSAEKEFISENEIKLILESKQNVRIVVQTLNSISMLKITPFIDIFLVLDMKIL